MACVCGTNLGVGTRAVVVLTDRWSEAAAMAAWGLTKQGRQAGLVRSLGGQQSVSTGRGERRVGPG